MQVGLTLPNRGVLFGATTSGQMLQMAEIADRSGLFQSVWVGDSLLGKPRMEAITLLAGVAARTKRVRLGPACMASIALRDPVLLAYQWASLDLLAGGRTVMVGCTGIVPQEGGRAEARLYEVTNKDRAGRLVEWITIMKRLWTEDHVTFQGEHYRFTDITIEPKPAAKPRPPIWLASNSAGSRAVIERTHRRVAEHAEGWETSLSDPEDVRWRVEDIKRKTAEAGPRPERDRVPPLSQHQPQRRPGRRLGGVQALPGRLLRDGLPTLSGQELDRGRLRGPVRRAPARLRGDGVPRGHASDRRLGPARPARARDEGRPAATTPLSAAASRRPWAHALPGRPRDIDPFL